MSAKLTEGFSSPDKSTIKDLMGVEISFNGFLQLYKFHSFQNSIRLGQISSCHEFYENDYSLHCVKEFFLS